jgi:dihydroxy-acid dehydratase
MSQQQEPTDEEPYAGSKDPNLRSNEVTAGRDRAPHRSMFRAMGFDDEDLESPMVGVANPAADITPCNVHLDEVAESALDGIDGAGGMPIEFGTITISDAISMGTEGMKSSLISREVIADSVELVAFGERMDALVTIGGCDKNMPGMMMAAIRTDLPSVFLYGGSIMPGEHDGREVTIQNVFEGVGAVASGDMTDDELDDLERHACPGAGSCGGMFTANTMASISEAIGFAPLGSASPPAEDEGRYEVARESGERHRPAGGGRGLDQRRPPPPRDGRGGRRRPRHRGLQPHQRPDAEDRQPPARRRAGDERPSRGGGRARRPA